MQNPYYDFSIPIFIKSLGGLKNILKKAEALATTEGGEAAFLEKSLAPDMFPFKRQVQIACDNAKGVAARLAQIDIPQFADTETTLGELEMRIDKTISFLNSITPEQMSEAAQVRVELPYFPGKHMRGDGFLTEYALPNFFFHVTIAYGIVRAEGGLLGKGDFMNGLPLRDNE